ncbi:MAG TPA: glycosyltransferase, partial [Burkholderiales bacterium]|nr:glycosyltransferase [Burkholderiales bacterium]
GAHIHVVGGETPGEEALFQEFVQGATATEHLTYHGRVPYRAACALYGRAHVLLNTSDVEGFPNAYLQAWQNGVPVVTLIDPDGVIEREGLGIVCSSAEELFGAVQRLLGDQTAWAHASTRCSAFMARHYNEDRILADYLAAFRDACTTTCEQRTLSPVSRHV